MKPFDLAVSRDHGSPVGSPSTRRVIHVRWCPRTSGVAHVVAIGLDEAVRQWPGSDAVTLCRDCKPGRALSPDREALLSPLCTCPHWKVVEGCRWHNPMLAEMAGEVPLL